MMKWEKTAEEELARVPSYVQPMVRQKVEEYAEAKGATIVTLSDLEDARERFKAVMSGKSESEMRAMMPADNEPGIEMVVIETCHNEMSNCPNPLIPTDEWKEAVEDWACENDISEKLRGMVKDGTIRYHNRLRISISGCPNGCSRPQIADIGLVGCIWPEFIPTECTSCGSCAEVCPDNAIRFDGETPRFDFEKCQGCRACSRICPAECVSLSEPSVRIMVGGKLGRHPHLADVIGEVSQPSKAVAVIDRIVNDYFDNAESGERFAGYWLRQGKKKYSE
jgi:dissimilatory sulfite reductase (desulfoviridin) alpha/beta subunit